MDDHFEKVLAVLKRYISPVNARALLVRVLQVEGISRNDLTPANLRKCSGALRRGLGLFVPPSQREAAMKEITEHCGSDSLRPAGCNVEVREELDVGRVRAEARRICSAAGTTSFVMQRVATIVSELTRNMVLYAGGGTLEIVLVDGVKRSVIVRAADQGPGIPNVDEIMSGRYKSRTGMGRGLMGTKRLGDRFEIQTNSRGTRIEVEVAI